MSDAKDVEALEIDLLLEAIFRRFGYDFRGHQKNSIRRKLHGFMAVHSIANVSLLQDKILHDVTFVDPLLRALEARSVGLFDYPEQINRMRELLIPWLRSCPAPKIWIAECSAAEDIYGLVILLVEENLFHKTRIYATGPNANLLTEARTGKFPMALCEKYERNYRLSGGVAALLNYGKKVGDSFVFNEDLKNNITWAQYNLSTDASFNEFEVILCCNGLSDFSLRSRHRALQVFYDSQPNFGILLIAGKNPLEAIPFISSYKILSAEYGIYQRLA